MTLLFGVPLSVPCASILWTTSIPDNTMPNTTCRPSNLQNPSIHVRSRRKKSFIHIGLGMQTQNHVSLVLSSQSSNTKHQLTRDHAVLMIRSSTGQPIHKTKHRPGVGEGVKPKTPQGRKSCFCKVWWNPGVGGLTYTSITAGRETDSKRLTKNFGKTFLHWKSFDAQR